MIEGKCSCGSWFAVSSVSDRTEREAEEWWWRNHPHDVYGDDVLDQHIESCRECGALVFVPALYAGGGECDTRQKHARWHESVLNGGPSLKDLTSKLRSQGSQTVMNQLRRELDAAEAKFGSQVDLPDGTSASLDRVQLANDAKRLTDSAAADGCVTWAHILTEEAYEAFAEEDPSRLRAELLQVAAVALRWVSAIDHRSATSSPVQAEAVTE